MSIIVSYMFSSLLPFLMKIGQNAPHIRVLLLTVSERRTLAEFLSKGGSF